MATRFYFVPKIGSGASPDDAFRPKYTDAGFQWQAMDHGFANCFLLIADVDEKHHAALSEQPDVLAFPAELNSKITDDDLAALKAKCEALKLPADWLGTTHSYAELVQSAAKMIGLSQRFKGLYRESLLKDGVTLDSKISEIPGGKGNQLAAAATSLGLDSKDVKPATTIRKAMKVLADQLPDVVLDGKTK